MTAWLKKINGRILAAVIPLLLVNAVSVFGQVEFWDSHTSFPLAGDIAFAFALESIAVYLAWQAHLAQLSDDSSLRLRLAAYGFGLIIGLLNASHYMHNGTVTALAVGMGITSSISPWLWSIHSRRQSRDILRERGQIDGHAVRLGGTRVFWHPLKSVSVMRHASWRGTNTPALAITDWETERAAVRERQADDALAQADVAADRKPPRDLAAALADVRTKAAAIRAADDALGAIAAPETARALAAAGWPGITAAHVRSVRSQDGQRNSPGPRNAIEPPPDTRALALIPGGNPE